MGEFIEDKLYIKVLTFSRLWVKNRFKPFTLKDLIEDCKQENEAFISNNNPYKVFLQLTRSKEIVFVGYIREESKTQSLWINK